MQHAGKAGSEKSNWGLKPCEGKEITANPVNTADVLYVANTVNAVCGPYVVFAVKIVCAASAVGAANVVNLVNGVNWVGVVIAANAVHEVMEVLNTKLLRILPNQAIRKTRIEFLTLWTDLLSWIINYTIELWSYDFVLSLEPKKI